MNWLKLASQGYCYRNAANYASEHGGEVVHGIVHHPSDGRAIMHAWTEDGETVTDPTIGLVTTKKHYYDKFKAQPQQRYSWEKALALSVRYRNWGPW